jgi:uncharacterized protein DUF4154
MAPLRSHPGHNPMSTPHALPDVPRHSHGPRRHTHFVVALALACVSVGASAPAARADVNQAKANMLWNIAKFVEWPGIKTGADVPLIFTILGEDELAVQLAGVLSSKTVNGHPVFVRFARRPQDAKGSQILYVAASELSRMTDVLAVVDTSAVLTVSDAPGFAAHGGMVGFSADGDRVRFEVNLNQAERTGLKLSAKLLALARLVTDEKPSGTP